MSKRSQRVTAVAAPWLVIPMVPALLLCLILTFPAAANEGVIRIVDQRGVTVELEKPAERVVLFPMPSASLFAAVTGGFDRIVGMHPMAKTAIEDGILGKIFPQAKNLPSDVARTGFVPNVEVVVGLNPDLVIQWNQGDHLIVPLENAGLKVMALNYGTQEDLQTWINLMGHVSGQTQRAEAIINWHQSKLASLREDLSRLPQTEKPKIIYFNRFADQLVVAGRDTYNDFYIQLVGGINPAHSQFSGFLEVNEEQILLWDPDIILIGNFDRATPDDVYKRPLWQSVSAVKNRRVYKIPLGGYRWDPPNQESPLMWQWLAMVAHPDRVSFDLHNQMKEAYRMLYGYELTDEDIASILQADLNRGAAYYDRFLPREGGQ